MILGIVQVHSGSSDLIASECALDLTDYYPLNPAGGGQCPFVAFQRQAFGSIRMGFRRHTLCPFLH